MTYWLNMDGSSTGTVSGGWLCHFCRLYGFGFAVLGKIAQVAVPVIALGCVTSSMWQPIPQWQYQRRLGDEYRCRRFHRCWHHYCAGCTLPDFGSFVHNRKHALIAAA